MEAGENSNEICGACETFRRNEKYLQKVCVKSEGRMLLQNKGIVLELILELSAVGCELDSSGSVYRLSEGTTVPARAMLSVCDTEIATQKVLLNLSSAAVHYYRQCCIDHSEHCAVSV